MTGSKKQSIPKSNKPSQTLLKRFSEDLQLKGLSPRTIDMYTRAVRQITKHYQKSPELISDEELRQYFLYNKNERKWSRVASTISLCGIKLFFTITLKRDWTSLKFVRPEKEKKLPVILTRQEVKNILYRIEFKSTSFRHRFQENVCTHPSRKRQQRPLYPFAATHS
jgi:site-specific recombinase XerD